MEKLVREMLVKIGEDPEREGLVKTPERVARAWKDIAGGYSEDPGAMVRSALFEVEGKEMILVNDIDFFSVCEHHMLPFFGKAHVAYIPDGKIVGLSKMARVVEAYARRLQVQERMTTQVAETIEEVLEPKGVGVVVEASHLCMMMRGVERQNAYAITSSLKGAFNEDSKTRSEFMELLRHRRSSFV
jgi:GTP cyclohydrolase I